MRGAQVKLSLNSQNETKSFACGLSQLECFIVRTRKLAALMLIQSVAGGNRESWV